MSENKKIKTVGIITTFRQPNWGSVLQAYSLQKVINRFGLKSQIIDYKYPNEFHWKNQNIEKPKNPITPFRKLKNKISVLIGRSPKSKMQLLNDFIDKELDVSRPIYTYKDLHDNPPFYDIYVSGSDQIWNPNTMVGDFSYMFDFVPDGSHIISYASSFSCLTIPKDLVNSYKKNLSRYYAISVRENNGKKILNNVLNLEGKVVLDPTLLLNVDEWRVLGAKAKKVKLPQKYILSYMLSYTFDVNDATCQLIEKVQAEFGLPILFLSGVPSNFKGDIVKLPRNYGIGVEEFLYLLDNAEIVVSSSFHGTAFALNYGKPLIAMGAKNEDDRVVSILENIRMLDHYVYADEIKNYQINPYYDYKKEQSILSTMRKESESFLIKAL